ncbi:MAG: hypothetical protein ACR2Q4_13545 [Geminicoccaceae bacterium]
MADLPHHVMTVGSSRPVRSLNEARWSAAAMRSDNTAWAGLRVIGWLGSRAIRGATPVLQAQSSHGLGHCLPDPLPTRFHEQWPLARKIDDLRASPFRGHDP